jgi:hypothetical protein
VIGDRDFFAACEVKPWIGAVIAPDGFDKAMRQRGGQSDLVTVGVRWCPLVSEGVVGVMDIGVMEYWKNGMLEGRRNLRFPPARLSILPSWPQPYFIGVLCVSKLATKLAKLPLKLAGEQTQERGQPGERGRRERGRLLAGIFPGSSPPERGRPTRDVVTTQWNQWFATREQLVTSREQPVTLWNGIDKKG